MQGAAPSHFVSYGRYLYTPNLFDALRNSDKSHSGIGANSLKLKQSIIWLQRGMCLQCSLKEHVMIWENRWVF